MLQWKLIFVSGVTTLCGCASIVSGSNQSLSVETRAEAGSFSGANCRLFNNKGTWFVTSPGSTTVNRSFEDLSVQCEKDGFEPGLLTVKSTTKGMAFGNILFGGIIGAGVDISTGAAYDYPPLITVIMGKSGTAGNPETQASTPQTPGAATTKAVDPSPATPSTPKK